MQLSLVLVSLFALAAQAAPAAIEKRSTTCGSTFYSTAQVNAAASAACTHVRAGTQAGSSTYPHRYNNYEGFDFDVSGPWYEFPMKTSGVYTGGRLPQREARGLSELSGCHVVHVLPMCDANAASRIPGADRVIINGSCGLAGQITHTGASGNAFVGCSGTN